MLHFVFQFRVDLFDTLVMVEQGVVFLHKLVIVFNLEVVLHLLEVSDLLFVATYLLAQLRYHPILCFILPLQLLIILMFCLLEPKTLREELGETGSKL